MIVSLKTQQHFKAVNGVGRKFYSAHFLVICAIVSQELLSFLHQRRFSSRSMVFCLGLKVGKKLGNACIRNKIKRRIRHITRNIYGNFINIKDANIEDIPNMRVETQHIASAIGIIVIPKKGFERAKFQVLQQEFHDIINKCIISQCSKQNKA